MKAKAMTILTSCVVMAACAGDSSNSGETVQIGSDAGETGQTDSDSGEAAQIAFPPSLPVISAGTESTCGIAVDSGLRCWGPNHPAPPPGSYVDVSTAYDAACAVRTDGKITCWPDSLNVSFPGDDYVQVMLAWGSPCALRRNGMIDCVTQQAPYDQETSAPEGEFTELSDSFGLCGIRVDGTIACWGGATAPVGNDFVKLATMDLDAAGSCGLDSQGKVTCTDKIPQPDVASRFAEITVAYDEACGILVDGTIQCWNVKASLGDTIPQGEFIRVSLGSGHACAVRPDHDVVCWGSEGGATPPAGGLQVSGSQ